MRKRLLVLFFVLIAATGAAWAGFHFGALKWHNPLAYSPSARKNSNIPSWEHAVEMVKADRGAGAYAAVEIPTELRHYEDRHWFLATQVAEVEKHKIQPCQDFVDLAAMIERGEMITLPAVTETYVLYGVGQKADDEPFTRYLVEARRAGGTPPPSPGKPTPSPTPKSIKLYSEAELDHAYKTLDETRSRLQREIDDLKAQSDSLKKGESDKQKELQKQITALQREFDSAHEDKADLDQFYAQPDRRQQLLREYQSLLTLAKNFAGRSFDLSRPVDRETMKVAMLSSLRPQALKILEEVASVYHRQFDRPLPVSSLVRPEQYQHALRRVNRNAVLIDTPPHSTGLAFDIDYRYMGRAEQTLVMSELARLKREGRIEVIRERNANYHVFAFIDGTRPSDDLIKASREKAGADEEEEQQPEVNQKSEAKQLKAAKKGKTKTRSTKARTRKRR